MFALEIVGVLVIVWLAKRLFDAADLVDRADDELEQR